MQTFLPFSSPTRTAKILDDKRLGKQRVEALQIADCLLYDSSSHWKHHPAVLMWSGYESYLVKIYIQAIMDEWTKRGFKNEKCFAWHKKLLRIVKDIKPAIPGWLNDDFCRAHQSNLLRKKPEYYSKYFVVPDNLEYIWPIKIGG